MLGFDDGVRRRQLEAERLRAPSAGPAPCAMPTTTPIAEANTPVNDASSITERITCLRLAPIARSNAVSLVRCATVIEKVL